MTARWFAFLFLIIFCHCFRTSPFLLDAEAGWKALCGKHKCKLKENSRGFYSCEKCTKEKQVATCHSVAAGCTTVATTDVNQLAQQMSSGMLLSGTSTLNEGDQQEVGGFLAQPIFPYTLSADNAATQSQGAGCPNEVVHTGQQSFAFASSGWGSQLWQVFNQHSAMMGVTLIFVGTGVLPDNECIRSLWGNWDSGTFSQILAENNMAYAGDGMETLREQLKRGQIIVRVMQQNGAVDLLFIQSSGDIAVLITGNGYSSGSVTPEFLGGLLTSVFSELPGLQIQVFVLGTQSLPTENPPNQPDDSSGIAIFTDRPPLLLVTKPTAVQLTASQMIIQFITSQLQNYQVPISAPADSPAIQALVSPQCNAQYNMVELMAGQFGFRHIESPQQEIIGLMFNQVQVLIQIYSPSGLDAISIEPAGNDAAQITVGQQQFYVGFNGVEGLLNWMLTNTGWQVRVFSYFPALLI